MTPTNEQIQQALDDFRRTRQYWMTSKLKACPQQETSDTIETVLQNAVAGQWQPIESAPRDGRMAIYYRPLAHLTQDPHVTIKRSLNYPSHVWEGTIPEGCDGLNYNDGSCYATHFMPLPAAPEREGMQVENPA